jgi:hypothetical protein
VPAGPYAVVVTNAQRTGATYQVLLIDTSGQIVGAATAQLPTVKPNQNLELPLASASNSAVYYMDGDSVVDALAPGGVAHHVTSIAQGSTEEVSFAVSPDGAQMAVAAISEQSDATKDTGVGYVEDVVTGADQGLLWNNVGSNAWRWPAGWEGSSVVDTISLSDYSYCGGGGYCEGSSYHIVDAATADISATVCEAPSNQPTPGPNGTNQYDAVDGAPVAAGSACWVTVESYGSNGYPSGTSTDTLEAVDWTGQPKVFESWNATGYGQTNGPDVQGCYLSPDGTRMACTSTSNRALTMVSSSGTETSEGHIYAILGWIDAGHLLVGVDDANLAVLDPDTGAVTTVPLAEANEVEMAAVLPGGL